MNSSGLRLISYRNRHSAAPSRRCACRKPSCSPADFTALRREAGLPASTHNLWARHAAMRLLAVAGSAMTRAPSGRPSSAA